MNNNSELRILNEYLCMINNAEEKKASYSRFTLVLLILSFLCFFNCFKGYETFYMPYWHLIVVGIFGGVFLGLAIWFSQINYQYPILIKHLDKKSLEDRIREISS